jgi:hypothetical protein
LILQDSQNLWIHKQHILQCVPYRVDERELEDRNWLHRRGHKKKWISLHTGGWLVRTLYKKVAVTIALARALIKPYAKTV